jgi:hypothetical protein
MSDSIRILFIGDVFGKPGRRALREHLPQLIAEREIDLTIVNGENSAGGAGITPATYQELREAGADIVTGGNHSFAQREILDFIDGEPRLLRPDNWFGVPGQGFGLFETPAGHRVAVLNLCGRTNLGPFENPFVWGEERVEALRRETPIIIVDFHAEVTSEKIAFSWHLDGKVSAVVGTHTHVQTADERVLPGGTAHISDVGMTGPHDSVLGVQREIIIQRFIDNLPRRFEPAKGDVRIHGVVIEVEIGSGKALSIDRIALRVEL